MAYLGRGQLGDIVNQINLANLQIGVPASLTVGNLTVISGASIPAFNSLVVNPSGTSELALVTQGLWQGSGITEAYGGTGQSSYAIGDVLVADSTASLTVLASGDEGDYLQVNGGALSWLPLQSSLPTVVTITAATATLADTERFAVVAGVGLVTVSLPPSPAVGQEHTVKDQQGVAAISGITVAGNGNLIDGLASKSLVNNYESMGVLWDGIQWSIV